MPIVRITSPDGKVYQVTAPDGATNEQINAFVAQNLPKLQSQPTAEDPKPKGSMGFREMAAKAVSNIPSSAVKFGEDIVSAFSHPVDTVTGLGETALGLAEKATGGDKPGPESNTLSIGSGFAPSSQKPNTQEIDERSKKADAMIQFVKNRYGSMDAFKNTVANDPVGFLSDIATIAVPLGSAIGTSGKVATAAKATSLGGALTNAGEVVRAAGMAVDPVNVAMGAAGTAMKAIPSTVPERIMQSALKINKQVKQADKEGITRAALENRVSLSKGGLEDVKSAVASLGNEIDAKVVELQKAGQTIPTDELFADLVDLTDRAGLIGQGDVVQRVADKIRSGLPDQLTPTQVQTIKRLLQHEVSKNYGKAGTFKIETQKNIARSARLALEDAIPEIGQMNQKESSLIKLQKAMDDAIQRVGNRDLGGIGTPLKVGAGAAVAGTAGAVAGTVASIFEVPRVKAAIAVMLNDMKKQGVKVRPVSTVVRDAMTAVERADNPEEVTNGN